MAMITVSYNALAGCVVYPRPAREGIKSSPTIAETMVKAPSVHGKRRLDGR